MWISKYIATRMQAVCLFFALPMWLGAGLLALLVAVSLQVICDGGHGRSPCWLE